MKIVQVSSFWWFCFTLLFFFALDFWHWKQPVTLAWLNLPPWIFYFLSLQLTLAIALFIFTRTFWQTSPREEPENESR